MPQLDRRLIIIASVVAVLLLFIGFGIGRLTGGSSDATASSPADSTSTTATISGDASAALPDLSDPSEPSDSPDAPDGGVPEYGTDSQRNSFLVAVAHAGLVDADSEAVFATGEHVCYNLERLQAQDRSAAFAVRVVWNESLAELDSQDLAAFAAVFNAAPQHLCPESREYAEEVAYWLGY